MSDDEATTALPTYFIPHGGGPCFFMDWTMGPADTWDHMASWLRQLHESINSKPDAIIVFSAHWENQLVTINSAANPPLYFDYYNFPPHTYELKYPAPGHPELANKIETLLLDAGIACHQDPDHGLDHGVFIPFMLIYPDADIPIVQVSLTNSLDPAEHLAFGKALAPLRKQNILLVGSGLSYHNMAILRDSPEPIADSDSFNQWLTAACEAEPDIRNQSLCNWQSAPHARQAHPREEHLLPLMVVAGAADDELGKSVYTGRVLGATVSGYRFG